MPIISVIIPVYNVEKYLEKCMDTVLNQSFRDFEVLLVDDGAKDSTPELCDKIAMQDCRVKVFHKKNGGVSDARNYGLDKMSGKYVTFIDSDDYISLDYLEYLYKLIVENNAQISMVQAQILLETEDKSPTLISREEKISSETAVRRMLLRREATHTCWGKLFDAALWDNIRFPKGLNCGEDYATYYVFDKAKTVAYSDAQMYCYIQRSGSIMHEVCSEKTLSVLDATDSLSEYLLDRWPNSKDEIIDLKIHTYLKNLQIILNTGKNSFLEYQERIVKFVRKNAAFAIKSKRVPFNDKVKVISLLFGKKVFLKVYNRFDGNRKI